MKIFYYAPSNDAYVELADDIHAEVERRLEENFEMYEPYYDDLDVFEMRQTFPKFKENEDYICNALHMTEEQFNQCILY